MAPDGILVAGSAINHQETLEPTLDRAPAAPPSDARGRARRWVGGSGAMFTRRGTRPALTVPDSLSGLYSPPRVQQPSGAAFSVFACVGSVARWCSESYREGISNGGM